MLFYDGFAGIGGIRLGMERAGHICIGGCENDKYKRQVYKKNFGHEPEHEDITKLDPKDIKDHDCFCAGFPCPAFSYAGKRLGFADRRGRLFFEIIRIVQAKRPRLLFLENVVGLLSHDSGRTFAVVLMALDEIGYDVEWQVFNSKYFVPQTRNRVFIVGHLRAKPTPKIFPIFEETTNSTKTKGKRQEVGLPLVGAILASYAKHPTTATYIEEKEAPKLLTLFRGRTMSDRIYDSKGIAKTIMASSSGSGARTGLYLIKSKVRMLTPLECERVQSLPDNFTEGLSDDRRYKAIGDSVTVDVIEYIARRLVN